MLKEAIVSLMAIGTNLFGVYSDASFSNLETEFSPSGTAYYRLESSSSGEREKNFRLLDSDKNVVRSLSPSSSKDGQKYVYTGEVSLPSEDGVYYLDVKLDDGKGSVFAAQRNINVGSGSGNVRSEARSEVRVNAPGQRLENNGENVGTVESLNTEDPEPTVESEDSDLEDITEEVEITNENEVGDNTWPDQLIGRFKNIISNLLSIFS